MGPPLRLADNSSFWVLWMPQTKNGFSVFCVKIILMTAILYSDLEWIVDLGEHIVFLSKRGKWEPTLGLQRLSGVHPTYYMQSTYFSVAGLKLKSSLSMHVTADGDSPNWQHYKQPEVKCSQVIRSKYPCVPRCLYATGKWHFSNKKKLNSIVCAPAGVWWVYWLEEINNWQTNRSGTSSLAGATAAS